jgi:hypothetical protein
MSSDTTVLSIARGNGREYITPEDVGEALKVGVPRVDVMAQVLRVLGRIEGSGAEDWSLCAFVAVEEDE